MNDSPVARLAPALMLVVLVALLSGLWAGLLRLGWRLPTWQTRLVLAHGPLMVAGFLGTLVALERAVALGQGWCYAAPALSGVGALALAAGAPTVVGAGLLAAGSAIMLLVSAVMVRRHPVLHTVVIAAGAAALLLGNLLWLGGLPLYRAAYWWAGFLLLVIAGERLELNRVRRPPRRVRRLFVGAVALFGAGLLLSLIAYAWGMRVAGAGAAATAAWLVRYDLARHNVLKKGLTRYIAANLLVGYGWLALSGLLGLIYAPMMAGPLYDAWLHTLFLGFVFGMVFAHAPIILPGVLGIQVPYRPILYLPPLLLHVSLATRIVADLLSTYQLRRWSGLINEIAIVAYLLLLIGVTVYPRLSGRLFSGGNRVPAAANSSAAVEENANRPVNR